MNTLDFLEMNYSDLESIKDILIDEFDDFWSYTTLKDEFSSSTSKYFVIKKNNIVLGFCGIKIITNFAEIMNIVIKKDSRGLGLSNFLLENTISKCKELNLKSINLDVNVENTIAINLYKKYNFVKVGIRKKYYNNVSDAILMTLNL